MIHALVTIVIFSGIHGKIQGVVFDEYTDEPIPYANVIILGTQLGAATDDAGQFFILSVPPGRYVVEISFIGYQTKRIENVIVEVDRTARLKISIEQTMIEMPPVTVTSEIPAVQKDYVGTTYIVRKTELAHLPIDYTTNIVAFQAGVVYTDTAIHVRGGRATEVLYMIDNVSIMDPQTGALAINLSKGVVDEVIFLPGGFDSEYGRAMSGVVNMISASPQDHFNITTYTKTEKIMPFYYDFGYQNYQSSIHLPITKKLKGLVSVDLMHTDDWDPRLYILPHKWRDDYSVYSKWQFTPSGKINLTLSAAQGRSQFDRYHTQWKFYLDHYRSDLRTSNFQTARLNYLPSSRYLLSLTVSRLMTKRIFGVRDPESQGSFQNFVFKDYETLEWPREGKRNPFGASYWMVICQGDYPEYQEKGSHVLKTKLSSILQIHAYHEIKTGVEYTYQELDNFSYFVSDTANQLIDEYMHKPIEVVGYIQDNIDYQGLYAKIGCRYEYYDWDVEDVAPISLVSPRVGFSFMVTDKFLFRTNIGRYVQPPLYDHIYGYYSLLPIPSYITNIPPIGNPLLIPEKTTSFEIGLQGEVGRNTGLTVNTFYKIVSDLVGTRLDSIGALTFVSYFNVEYANVRGIEAILDFTHPRFEGKISYTLSWASGVSSYATEVWERRYIDPEFKPAAKEYYLDFDQRRKLFIQGIVKLPYDFNLHLFGYVGDGFPYTPPGPEGKFEERNILRLPFQRKVDCVLSKTLKVGRFSLCADFEIMNTLGARYEVNPHFPMLPLKSIKKEYFDHGPPYIDMHSNYYAPSADINHDGIITPFEEYKSFHDLIEATDDWVSAYTAPRRARLGISVSYQIGR